MKYFTLEVECPRALVFSHVGFAGNSETVSPCYTDALNRILWSLLN
jgi:hypothetical protein